jgi:hypothetical protein
MAQPLLYRWRLGLMWDDRLTAADRHVALTLALFMDLDGGSCRPSVRRLEWMAKRKRQTVITSIKNLERCGWLAVKRGGIGKNKTTSQYAARCPKGHLSNLPQGASLVPAKVPEGAHELFNSSEEGASLTVATSSGKKKTPPCSDCGAGGGHHAADCSKAAA